MKRVAVFILTANCNMSCKFCVSNDEKDMSTEYVKEKIKRLPKHVKRVCFTGGEVLLRNDLFELLRYAKKLGYETNVSTNATLLDSLTEEQLNLIDIIQVPLDGLEKKHDELRGRGHFRIVMNALNELKDKRIVINTVVTKLNHESVAKLDSFLKKYKNVIKWKIYRFKPVGRGKKYEELFKINKKCFDALKLRIKNKKAKFIDDIEDYDKEYYKFVLK
jgi:MoaA/NifB/PqqE/SkfB family radical SAM enzyme